MGGWPIPVQSGLFARLSAGEKPGVTNLFPARGAGLATFRTRSVNDAVLDHPGSQQPVAWWSVVSALVGILVDLRPDEAGEPDPRRLLHARHLFPRGGAAVLQDRESTR